MSDAHSGIGFQAVNSAGHRMDGLHPVVDQKNLPSSIHLPMDGLTQDLVGPGEDVGDDGHPIPGRGLDQGEVSDSG